MMLKLLLAIFCVIFMPTAWADKSLEYLSIVIGPNLALNNSGAQVTVVSKMFEQLNYTVFILGSIVVGYISVVGVVKTASEGEILGKDWSSVWIPVRSLLGLLLLVPGRTSGYSAIQIAVMYVITVGVNMANGAWNIALGNFQSATHHATAPNAASRQAAAMYTQTGKSIAENTIFPSLLSFEKLKAQVTGPYPGPDPRSIYLSQTGEQLVYYFDPASRTVKIDPPNSAKPDTVTITGQIKFGVPSSEDYTELAADIESQGCSPNPNPICLNPIPLEIKLKRTSYPSGIQDNINLINEANRAFNANLNAHITMLQQLQAIAASAVANDTETVDLKRTSAYKNAIKSATKTYVDTMTAATTNSFTAEDMGNLFDQLRQDGWATAAGLYWKINKATTPVTAPQVTPTPASSSYSEEGGAAQFASDAKNMVRDLGTSSTGLFEEILDSEADPLAVIASIGGTIMFSCEMVVISLFAAGFVLSGIMGVMSGLLPFFMTFISVAGLVITLVGAIIPIIYSIGVLMAIFIPLIPFITFAGGVISWFILVIEALLAAPLVAFTMVMPGAEEFGEAGKGLLILFGIAVRPMLLIIGLVFAMTLIKIILMLVNSTIGIYFSSLNDHTSTSSIFSPLIVLVLYALIVFGIVSKCCSIIYTVADRFLSTFGIVERTDVSGLLSKTKAGTEAPEAVMKAATGAAVKETGKITGKSG